MNDVTQLGRGVGKAPTWRRDHRKADGRMLYLYGRKPHTLQPMSESADDIFHQQSWRAAYEMQRGVETSEASQEEVWMQNVVEQIQQLIND